MIRYFPHLAMMVALAGALGFAAATDARAEAQEIATQTLKEDGMFSIHRHPPALVAEVELPETGATFSAFRILYAYITGDNSPEGREVPDISARGNTPKGQKIPMTVPVTVASRPDATVMRFYLPETQPPLPWDQRIVLKRIPAQTFAVIRFSGLGMDGQMANAETNLRTWIGQHGAVVGGAAIRAYYNPPWTLPWDRRNEVWIPLSQMPTR